MHFVIIGAGPAGSQAATDAARLGVEVTLIEREVVGGAANLWDCVPSKTMIATGGAMTDVGRLEQMGLGRLEPSLDLPALKRRITGIAEHLERATTEVLRRQGVRLLRGTGRLTGPRTVLVEGPEGTETLEADAILLATGSRPRVPAWAEPDGQRVLVTRDAYPPPELPEHLVVVGSGVTGVEFVHMFTSLGAQVSLVVSRQQVLPGKDPEVAAALEEEFLRRGVQLLKGARAVGLDRHEDGVTVHCHDGRAVRGSHVLLAVGSIPNSAGLGLEAAGVEVSESGHVPINHHCQTNVPHIYAAGDLSGKLPLSSVATMQGRKIAEHVVMGHTAAHRHLNYDKAPSAIFTDPEIADVGLAEAEAFASGRKIRVTKVPFSASPRALISGDTRGFVKIVSDPATGVVLGGSIVGRNASELIAVLAVAVTAGLRVQDIVDSMPVHPALAEALAEAAD
ncbi:FAD-dependent oxidoreductase [Aciditerrimonas ferrireducens]|uniref:FAD-dependent oxidoreductase n=1 Tax=Aciditerrimonas ferrireducens TaxID=667306 RepID=UPI002005506C|nr:FAD-dependent oxidoreductase [Aciditerrimonas ferrireducens]MCK4175947.1 FAD-dependent oxidoreductase [Aciditerrimonas ferrireducens]